MICYIKNNKTKEILIKLELEIYSYDLIVVDIYNFVEDAPIPFSYIKDTPKETQINIIEKWLKSRAVPNTRIDLDKYLLNRYELMPRKHLFGRMYETQYTAALLSYFVSPFDDFYIIPEKDQFITYVNYDARFWNLYLWRSENENFSVETNINLDYDFNKCLSKCVDFTPYHINANWNITPTDTLPSSARSFWFKKDEQLYLQQDISCFTKDLQDKYTISFPQSFLEGNILTANFSNVNKVILLNDILLFLQPMIVTNNDKDLLVKDILIKYTSFPKSVIKSLIYYEKMFSQCNLGLAFYKNDYIPFVLL